MDYFEHLLESVFQRRIPEAEADSAESNVRVQRIGLEIVGENGTDDESCRSRRDAPETQSMVAELGKGFSEFRRANRIAVYEEIPAAVFRTLGKVHQRSGTVVDVNRRNPRPLLSKLQDTTASRDRLDDVRAKP